MYKILAPTCRHELSSTLLNRETLKAPAFFQLCPNSSKVGYKRPVGVSANPNLPYPKKLGHINSLCCPTLLGHGAMYTKGESSKNQFGWLYQEVMGSKLYPCPRSVLELQPCPCPDLGPNRTSLRRKPFFGTNVTFPVIWFLFQEYDNEDLLFQKFFVRLKILIWLKNTTHIYVCTYMYIVWRYALIMNN